MITVCGVGHGFSKLRWPGAQPPREATPVTAAASPPVKSVVVMSVLVVLKPLGSGILGDPFLYFGRSALCNEDKSDERARGAKSLI